MSEPGKYKAIVLFDGFCNICSGLVLFIIRRDPGMRAKCLEMAELHLSEFPENGSVITSESVGVIIILTVLLIFLQRDILINTVFLRITIVREISYRYLLKVSNRTPTELVHE